MLCFRSIHRQHLFKNCRLSTPTTYFIPLMFGTTTDNNIDSLLIRLSKTYTKKPHIPSPHNKSPYIRPHNFAQTFLYLSHKAQPSEAFGICIVEINLCQAKLKHRWILLVSLLFARPIVQKQQKPNYNRLSKQSYRTLKHMS